MDLRNSSCFAIDTRRRIRYNLYITPYERNGTIHVLHWVAVEADSKEDALGTARMQLESIMGEEGSGATWYDWFVSGGGRWNPNEGSQYDDNDYSMVISAYEAGNDVFTDKINKCLESRMREFNDYRESYNKAEIDLNAKLDTYTGVMDYSFDLYPLKKMIDMIQGEWDFNSYFFDLTSWSTNPKYILDKIEKDSKDIYLVPIDFHF